MREFEPLSHLWKCVPIAVLQVSLGSDAPGFSDEAVTPQLYAGRQGGEMLCWLCKAQGRSCCNELIPQAPGHFQQQISRGPVRQKPPSQIASSFSLKLFYY